MADDASVSIQATILPDEIAKTLTGTMTVTPDDANDKWYYKLTSITTTSADLIAGRFPNTTVGNIHAISSDIGDAGDASVTAIVCALIDDV